MSNNELYKQAIADAKSLKDITMEKAKQQIAEAFTPKIQEMFRLKVNELEEEMEEEGKHMEEENFSIDEAALDEILAELQEEEEMEEAKHMEEEGLEEGKHMEEEGLEEAESKEEEEKEDEKEEGKEEGEHEAEEVAELSVEEFKELVRDVVADVLAGNTGEEEGLDDLGDMGDETEDSESLSLDEILAELQNEEAIEEAKKGKKDEKEDDEKHKMEEELNNALATIAELRSSINEMNLFNAKLLYSSKILESKNLNAAQKAKVLKAFDAAKTTSEVKQTYKVLNETYEAPSKKQSIKESIGFASKPIGNAPAKPIVETDAFATRMQQLAGIIKPKI